MNYTYYLKVESTVNRFAMYKAVKFYFTL